MGFPASSLGNESICNAGNTGDEGLIIGSGRFPGGGHGNLVQYSCVENPMDRGAQQAIVYRLAKSWTPPKWLKTHTHTHTVYKLYNYLLHICSCLVAKLSSPLLQAPLSMGFLRQEYWSGLPFPFSRASSQPRDWTQASCNGKWILYHWATWEVHVIYI